ncbi:MAG: polysaccharide deacetylase family protein [Candidatus Atribacteria bacterium]|nr:polysaccharide deacetylase family protein [Candidatus Atribacteria bacterium]
MDKDDETQKVKVCPWLGDKRWAYSVTFDEALSDLKLFAIPILEEYGVPGHVEVVVGQIGEIRHLFESSYNGMKHMGAEELRDLLGHGWGVGNHSWSHTLINAANADWELRHSKQVLEEAIGEPVTIYCSPGDNHNATPEILEACRRYGYLGAMAVYEALNRPDDENLLWLNRTFLHDQGPNQHETEFNPFRQILHAQHDRGWIIDYLHCPLEKPIHPRKDCSADQLRRRIEAIVSLGGEEVWLTRMEHISDYRYTRQFLRIEPVGDNMVKLTTPGLPGEVRRREITLELPAAAHSVDKDGKQLMSYIRGNKQMVDVDVSQETILRWFG